jgi:hemerythrin-like domain-containing protein
MMRCGARREDKSMSELTELGQVLHEEHFRILVSICGLENRVIGPVAADPLDPSRAEDKQQLQDLMCALDDVLGHHAFEESVIFPLIRSGGEGELAGILAREHGAIEPMAARLRVITADILENGIDEENWGNFREAARELIDEVMRHLQKEELNIVQRMDVFLDHETDHRLAIEHATAHPGKHVSAGAAAATHGSPKRSGAIAQLAARRIGPAAEAAQIAARRRSTSTRHPAR